TNFVPQLVESVERLVLIPQGVLRCRKKTPITIKTKVGNEENQDQGRSPENRQSKNCNFGGLLDPGRSRRASMCRKNLWLRLSLAIPQNCCICTYQAKEHRARRKICVCRCASGGNSIGC